eukprot:6199263-Pleurochrysis_carterae.AAC.2
MHASCACVDAQAFERARLGARVWVRASQCARRVRERGRGLRTDSGDGGHGRSARARKRARTRGAAVSPKPLLEAPPTPCVCVSTWRFGVAHWPCCSIPPSPGAPAP